MKIVINARYGGFSLSKKACQELGLPWHTRPGGFASTYSGPGKCRADPRLVAVVEKLGKEAGGQCASLKIVEVPDDVDWEISEHDGWESVEEKHRSWD